MQPSNHSPDDGSLPDLPAPLLIIDWGIEPQAGNHLPLDDDRWALSRLISRRHLRFTLHAEGLQLEDCRATFGTYFNGQQVTTPLTITQPASGWLQRHTLDVAGVLSLEVTLHGDRGWDDWLPYCDTGQSFYAAAAVGCHPPPLWELACQSRIDAVRLRRRAVLPLPRHLDRIKAILQPGHQAQWESVSQAAAAIQPIDHLADREQYILVYRTATVGSSDQAAITLPGAGLSDIAARILYLGGGLGDEVHRRPDAFRLSGDLRCPAWFVSSRRSDQGPGPGG